MREFDDYETEGVGTVGTPPALADPRPSLRSIARRRPAPLAPPSATFTFLQF
jgi:hypothetical protein